jgi:hypothetical protein
VLVHRLEHEYNAIAGRGGRDRMKDLEQRLLVEAAIDEGLPVRLESRTGVGRLVTRIVRPVALENSIGTPEAAGILVVCSRERHEIRIDLSEIDDLSLVTTGLPSQAERQGAWKVGDAVHDAELGLGVVQAFRASEDRWDAVVRFASLGARRLSMPLPASYSRG